MYALFDVYILGMHTRAWLERRGCSRNSQILGGLGQLQFQMQVSNNSQPLKFSCSCCRWGVEHV